MYMPSGMEITMSEQDNNVELGNDLAATEDNNAHLAAAGEEQSQSETTAEPEMGAESEASPQQLGEGPAPVEIADDGSVNYKLEQTDDEPRQPHAEPLGIAAIAELGKTGQDWAQQYDPTVGFKATARELETAVVPVKIYQVVPDMEGGAAKGTQKVENGVLQYKPKAVLKNFPVKFNKEEVTSVFSGLLSDSLSKYLLEHYAKPFSKLVENKAYGRKMPIRAFNTGSKISLDCVAELSGVTLEQFMHDLLRSGWFRKSAATQQFELAQMCETDEQKLAILSYAGKAIANWKSSDFPHHHATAAIYKRVGKLVEEDFNYKGKAPRSTALYSIVDCIDTQNARYENFFNTVEAREEQIAAGDLDPSMLTQAMLDGKQNCMVHLGRWAMVKCGLEAMAKELAKKEAEALAKANAAATKAALATGADATATDPLSIEGMDFMEL